MKTALGLSQDQLPQTLFTFTHCALYQSNENNLICLFITQTPEGFVVVDSSSILYSSKIVYVQVDWFTGCNGIMIEH